MPKLFVANITKHVQHFMYRIPNDDSKKVYEQIIQPGQQIPVWREDDENVLNAIVEQHRGPDSSKPWIINEADVGKFRGFAGLVYSIERPIDAAKIEKKMGENTRAMVEAGKENRKAAALATDQQVKEVMGEAGAEVGYTATEIVEETKPGEEIEGKIAEGVEVGNSRGRNRSK